jgi:ABC-2 type transport system ATP-binding protein
VTTPDEQRGIAAKGLGLLTSSGWVYRDVDLDVPLGSVALVSGPAGCGKTALLLTLAARMRPSAGALRLAAPPPPPPPPPPRRLVGLGETAGVNELDATLTVAAQVKAELALHGKRRTRADVALALAPVGLGLDARVKVGDLHAADRLLLGVALALIGRPPFLVVDDLHEDLTPADHVIVLARLRELAHGGLTVVAGSLDPSLAAHADVVLWLDADGRPATGPVGAVSDAAVSDAAPAPVAATDPAAPPTATPLPTPRKEADRALV